MLFSRKSAVTVLVLALASAARAKFHASTALSDLPGFRYTLWGELPQSMKDLAAQAGYSPQTWNQIGTLPLEKTRWSEIGSDTKDVLEQLGWSSGSWDCYVNHYDAYWWDELAAEDMTAAARALGFDEDSWDNDGKPEIWEMDWADLSEGQKIAASEFCFFEGTWGDLSLHNLKGVPVVYPYFRYIEWDDLPDETLSLASTVGWTKETWNQPDAADFAFTAFSDLNDERKLALFSMGFSEESYDCYINHYLGYSWQELTEYGLDEHFKVFGWTPAMYDTRQGPDSYESTYWDDLNEEQRDAADSMCWFKELWDETPLPDWGAWDDQVDFPQFRYTAWNELGYHHKILANDIGWTRSTWDVPGTAEVEKSAFRNLSENQQIRLRKMGFYAVSQYDCYVNHYNGFQWDVLPHGVKSALEILGWTVDSWNEVSKPPLSDDKDWHDLTKEEKEAADEICYFEELWDYSPLYYWDGVAWPEKRYWSWDRLSDRERELMTKIGYTESTWNNPGDADFEDTTWDNLGWHHQDALAEFGMYKAQWDCYVAHYDDFEWEQLVLAEVEEFFMVLGWTEEKWNSDEKPWAWEQDWDDLNEAYQAAAKEICYIKETWDEVPLTEWHHTNRDTSAARSSGSGDDERRPGLIAFLVILLLGVVGAMVFVWRRFSTSKKDITTPTFKDAGPPLPANETFDDNSTLDEAVIT